MLLAIALYTLLGAMAGLLSGLLGIGGGIVIVPSLLFLYAWQGLPGAGIHMAIGTSLAAMVLITLSAARAHHKRGAVRWELWRWVVPGMLVGVTSGMFLADTLPTDTLQLWFAAFLCIVALKMLWGGSFGSSESRIPKPLVTVIGVLVGTFSGLLGIGGGILLVPFLHSQRLSMPQASGTALTCTLPTVCLGAVTAMLVGLDKAVPAATGYVYWPAVLGIGIGSLFSTSLGAHLAHKLPAAVLKRCFGGLLLIVAWRMVM